MKLHSLSGRKACNVVLRKGRAWKGQTMIIRWLAGTPSSMGRPRPLPPGVYLGTYASTSLDASAVRRNRMRRRCREAMRLEAEKIDNVRSAQLLLTPRSASLDASFEAIRQDAATFLSQLRP